MPLSPGGRQLTEAHRKLQVRIAAQTAGIVIASFPLLDPEDLDATSEAWISTVMAGVQGQRAKSAATAATYLQTLRVVELGETFTPILAGPASTGKLATSLMVTGPIGLKANLGRGMLLTKAAQLAMSAVAGSAVRHSMDGARETVRETTIADPRARGWERVTSGTACDFCESLTDQIYSEAGAQFESHDRCTCSAAPSYD